MRIVKKYFLATAFLVMLGGSNIVAFDQRKTKEMEMQKDGKELVLYIRESCPYCQKVIKYLEASGTKVTIKDALLQENKAYLLEHGKKTQVPCLFIGEEPMFESEDIITFFKNHKD